VLRILLGGQLRRLREAKRISREDAGEAIRGSGSKISRMELGRVGFKERDIADLLTLYGVLDEDERNALLALAEEANKPGWWHRYADVLPDWFQPYLGLEGSASRLRIYEGKFVPGPLQTEEYARAVMQLGRWNAPATEIEHRVQSRMARQRQVFRPDGPQIWAVVDEAALRRPIGGPAVMRDQLVSLKEATSLIEGETGATIRLQVVPFSHGGYEAAGGAFTILRFGEPDLPDVVYLEFATGALYLDRPEDTADYLRMMERLCVEADPPDQTTEILEKAIEDLAG
jgi:transcriptional regulator with XRE-family HTH domain